jgi:hypothetical protein
MSILQKKSNKKEGKVFLDYRRTFSSSHGSFLLFFQKETLKSQITLLFLKKIIFYVSYDNKVTYRVIFLFKMVLFRLLKIFN